jgi:two-component system OmpR family response regulator
VAAEGRVLVIEDDKRIQELIKMALTQEGYEVAFASDGAAGLELAASFKPNLIYLDVLMPVMNGAQFLERYLRTPTPRAAVIALTASHNLFNVVSLGIDDFITKPFDIEKLVNYTKRYVEVPHHQ